jgi:hypothetical protein
MHACALIWNGRESVSHTGQFKVYYFIDGDISTPLPAGLTPGVQSLEAPVVFDLSTDWSENHPLKATEPAYVTAKAAVSFADRLFP